MTWTPLLSAALFGTLVLVGGQNVNLESFRNSGFTPLNGAGRGSGAGLNGLQGNFGGVGATGAGVNRFGSTNRAGYNYPVPANSLTFGGSAALGPAGGFLAPSVAPQLPGYQYLTPQGGQASLGGAGGIVPVRQGNSGSLASTISQILQQLTGSQVSSVIGPSGGRNNLPIGNVNFFTASDPSESLGFRAPAPTFPAHNFRFLQPRTQTNAFVAIAPGQIPPASRGQSALGGGLAAGGGFAAGGGLQSIVVAEDDRRNLEQPAPALPQPQALTFIPTPQQTPTLVAAPLPVGPAPSTVEPTPVAPTPVEPAPAVTPLVSGGVPLQAVEPSSATTGINTLPTFGILLGSVPTSGLQTQGGNFGNIQGFNNLPIVDIANLGLGGQQFGGLLGGTQGFQLAPGFGQSLGNDLNSFRNVDLGAGAGGFGAGQNSIIGSGVGLQTTGTQTGLGDVGTGIGAGGSFGVGLAPVVAPGGNVVSNLVIGSSGAGSTQGAGSGSAAELASLAQPEQAAGTAGANELGGANLRNLEQPIGGNPTQTFGFPLSLTGPQFPVAATSGLGGDNFRNLEQPTPVAAGGVLPTNEIGTLQTETNPLLIGLAQTGAQQSVGAGATGRTLQSEPETKTMGVSLVPQIPSSVAADASQANGAIESNIIGRRTLQTESQVQLFGVSLSETGPQQAGPQATIPGSVAVSA